jgi:hypothetical protein
VIAELNKKASGIFLYTDFWFLDITEQMPVIVKRADFHILSLVHAFCMLYRDNF